MQTLRRHPHIYQLDALPWLMGMASQYSGIVRLIDVSDDVWKQLKASGIDLVWLMGIWERSPEAKAKALQQSWIKEYAHQLTADDITVVEGSPYSVKSYQPDARIATSEELMTVRKKMNQMGLRLILDFVPNHTAIDHSWIQSYPELYVQSEITHSTAKNFEGFYSGDKKIAYGKDPHFDPWTDTAQLDYRSAKTHQKMTETLLNISQWCDGVRCDMAMLVCPDIFEQSWNSVPTLEVKTNEHFWMTAVEKIKKSCKDFIFIGEVYWGREAEFISLGFDYCYDKTFYDTLRDKNAVAVLNQIQSMKPSVRDQGMRFIENHDEERSASVFGAEKSQAAAAIIYTLPGLRFLQAGQPEGFRSRKPVQLLKSLEEVPDEENVAFYRKLMHFSDDAVLHEGDFSVPSLQSADVEDRSYTDLLAWRWTYENQQRIIIVNYSGQTAVARLPMEFKTRYTTIEILDLVDGSLYKRDADQMKSPGLFVRLNPWQVHLFSFKT